MAITRLRATIPLATCLVVLALMTACSSAGRTKVAVPKSHSIPHEATSSLLVESVTKKSYQYQIQIEQLIRKGLSTSLVNSGIFKSVSNRSSDSDYRIDARIQRIRIRSPAARVLFGFMAGRSYIQVQVDVRETKTDRLITSFLTTGYGAKSMIGAQSYGYDDPVREVVANVVHNLR